MSLVITLILGAFFFVGVLVIKFFKETEKIEHASVAIALGAMIALAVFDICPEVLELITLKQLYLPLFGAFIGFYLLKLLDRFIPEHEDEQDESYTDENMAHIGLISTIAIVLHNIIEGMAVYSFTAESLQDGLNLAFGIGLHNIPMGMFIFSTLRSEKRLKKYLILLAAGLSTFAGGLIMQFVHPLLGEEWHIVLYGIALGMILYIIFLELLPFVRKNENKNATAFLSILGALLVFVSTLFG